MPYLCVTGEGKYDKDDVDRKEFTLLGIVVTQKSFENNTPKSSFVRLLFPSNRQFCSAGTLQIEREQNECFLLGPTTTLKPMTNRSSVIFHSKRKHQNVVLLYLPVGRDTLSARSNTYRTCTAYTVRESA